MSEKTSFEPPPLTRASAGEDPLALFSQWLEEVEQAGHIALPNAMNLTTVDAQGRPHARMVLFKGFDQGDFVWYTNYESAKAQELAECAQAALTFWWEPPGRQVRVEGSVRRLDEALSDAYFHSRPRSSQLGAHASRQSEVVANRQQLTHQFAEAEKQFSGSDVPRPEFWGGYALTPQMLEFWQNASSRMHDRIRFQRQADGEWHRERLSP